MKANNALKKAASNVAAAKTNEPKSIKDLVKQMQPEIAKALPSVMTPERFTRIVISAVSGNKDLQACTAQSFLGAMMNAAQLGVEPNTPLGQAYLIPYKNRKEGTVECQFQLGYKGLLDLAYRTGEYQSIAAYTVYENDFFEYELGLDAVLKHKPAMSNRGNAIAYYAVYHLKNGGNGFVVMSREDVEQHKKKYSKAYNSPWNSDFDAMAKKTVIKQLLKYAPLKSELASAIAQDGTVKTFDGKETDMSLVADQSDYYDIEPVEEDDGVTVDPETGEVLMDGMTSAEVDAMLAAEELEVREKEEMQNEE